MWGSRTTVLFATVLSMGILCALPASAQLTVDPTAVLNSNATTDTRHDDRVHIDTDRNGVWIAVWDSRQDLGGIGADQDIFFSRSLDNGTTWTPPAALNTNAATDASTAFDLSPFIAADGMGNWICVWRSTGDIGPGAGTDNDIIFSASSDDGVTWSAPAVVHSNANTDTGTDAWPFIATDREGTWIVVWYTNEDLAGAGTDNDIMYVRSTNLGTTWSAPSMLNDNAATDIGTDIRPHITSDGADNWVCVWTSGEELGTTGTDADIFFVQSSDDGVTWTSTAALNALADTDTGSDENARVAADGKGRFLAVWRSREPSSGAGGDKDIWFANSITDGKSWSGQATLNTEATSDIGDEDNPQIMSDGVTWVAAWHSTEDLNGTGTDADIFWSTSTGSGVFWTAPQAVSASALVAPGATDQLVQLATDRMGNWLLTWDSKEDLNALGLGSDREIFVAKAQSVNPPNLAAGNGSVYGVLMLLLAFTGVILGLTFVKREN
jgi:BNR repeat-like domain